MDVERLKWCLKQNKGIKIIKPNNNLAGEYIKSAEETLLVLQSIKDKSNMWISTTKYYCEYFAAYSLLMKIGIKSEIHDCTIELSTFLEDKELLPKGSFKLLEQDKRLRIDNQYYLKNKKVEFNPEEIREFIIYIKDKLNTITVDEISNIRKEIVKFIDF